MIIVPSKKFSHVYLVINDSLDRFGYYSNVMEYKYKNLLQLFPRKEMGSETFEEIDTYLQIIQSKLGKLAINE